MSTQAPPPDSRPPLLVTIDAEADNSWARPPTATVRNAQYVGRFQALCESHGFKVTYLTDHVMASSPVFQEFGRAMLRRGTGEVGMHLHAWTAPPLIPLTGNDVDNHPYLIEHPEAIMREKIARLTALLQDAFGVPIVSHRAGRWGFDETYARLLHEAGYLVDCSVTPGVSWKSHPGDPEGEGGSDFSHFPASPYFLDLDDISRPGRSSLLEVPVTIQGRPATPSGLVAAWLPSKRLADKVSPPRSWLRPDGHNRRRLLEALDRLLAEGAIHAELMLHSSELMPGGSPSFTDERSIERLYEDLSALLEAARDRFSAATLAEFRQRFRPTGDSHQPVSPARVRRPSGRVLVLGGDTRSLLSVVRSLGRRGLEVHVAWCQPTAPALRSRYVHAVHDVPRFRAGIDRWKRALLALMRAQDFDLTIPCNDPSLLPLQAHREELEAVCRLAIPETDAFEVAFDKIRSSELAVRLGIPVPPQIVVRDAAEASRIGDRLGFPVVLKPRASFTLSRLHRKEFVHVARDRREAERLLADMLSRGPVLAQKYFAGGGVGVEVLAERGEILTAFEHVRLHEPRTGGGSSYRKSVALDADLLHATRALLAALRYTGVAMVEFKRNASTGQWIFVEINGRFWGSLPLALACGVDFPYDLYRLLVEGHRTLAHPYPVGIHARNLLNDLSWLADGIRAAGAPRAFARLLPEAAAGLVRALALRERSDTFVSDDLGPGLAEMGTLAARVGRAAAKQAQRLLALTAYRRRQQARVRARLSHARTILFVCKGNICRSPFAAAYAQKRLPSARVLSAGYHRGSGRQCPDEAVRAARAFGVDLAAHRSTGISSEVIRAADVIFTFDDENFSTLRRRYRVGPDKLYPLEVLDPSASEFPDPLGQPAPVVEAVYRRIARALDECPVSCAR